MIKRYETKEIRGVFSEEYKLRKWLEVETTVAKVEERAGIIPKGLNSKLRHATVTPERVQAIERVTNHDVIAFIEAVREKLGKEGKWLHFGLTSYDLVDTAFVLTLREAFGIIFNDIEKLLKLLKVMSKKYINTPQMGRTHGVFAQPISFGYKVASWHEEVARAYGRLQVSRQEISYGKLSGAVGTYTMLSPGIEKQVMKELGLKPEPVSTQVLPRDRFASMMSNLALYACALERIGTEIRNLSRTEIGEVSEPFTEGQKGSSAMPHKKNPIMCERVCGLARIVRSYLIPAYENINLWHERDITNSSAERILFPDAFHLIHYMTRKMLWVLEHLNVYPQQMLSNISMSHGVYASQNLMNMLVKKGMDRGDAYKVVQRLSFRAVKTRRELKEICQHDRTIQKYLVPGDLNTIFDVQWFLRNIRLRH